MERELTSDELDAVSGGGDMLTITKLMDPPSSGGGYVGGGGTTPAGAWNDCLRGYGFPPMA
jgi:hypothetical protein